jgi:hypothetical protein
MPWTLQNFNRLQLFPAVHAKGLCGGSPGDRGNHRPSFPPFQRRGMGRTRIRRCLARAARPLRWVGVLPCLVSASHCRCQWHGIGERDGEDEVPGTRASSGRRPLCAGGGRGPGSWHNPWLPPCLCFWIRHVDDDPRLTADRTDKRGVRLSTQYHAQTHDTLRPANHAARRGCGLARLNGRSHAR